MRSVAAVGVGMLLAFAIVLLIVFGVFAPVLSELFRVEPTRSSLGVFAPLLLFVCAFAFYFGGMAAAYKAPSRRRLHGLLIAPTAFVISTAINVLVGRGPFPGYDSVGISLLAILFFAVSVGASYVGARRGEALFIHNDRAMRRHHAAKSRRSR
jgi:hypothetical protein